ncbi:MAG TPA: GNAT family N-acetyltransferase [Aggregatilineales bacterium]|nr:GNAT family N-acetyltransferase [Anaerolineales bacterium]HRE47013.1 GNAT family N-acetyltransferase [Aggregatilineales bacterium]
MTSTTPRTLNIQLQITFRLAVKDDLPKLEWGGEYKHFRRVFQRTYEEQLAGERLMLLAICNDYPIGQVFMQLESWDRMFWDFRKRGYFYSVRVMEAFRGMGLGTAILHEAEQVLIERDYHSVSIAAAHTNTGARRLYERNGYRVVAEDSGRWSYVDHEGRTQQVNEPCWILEKTLRP